MARSIALAPDASRLASLLLSYIRAVCAFVAPRHPGASSAIVDRSRRHESRLASSRFSDMQWRAFVELVSQAPRARSSTDLRPGPLVGHFVGPDGKGRELGLTE